MNKVFQEMLDLLKMEQIREDVYRGSSQDLGLGHVFGGQVLGQALMTAGITVPEDRFVHSLHAYFLKLGRVDKPIDYLIHRIRDGRSFSTRRIVASQDDKAIFNMSISYKMDEEGFEYQSNMPNVLPPESLVSDLEIRRQMAHMVPEKLRPIFLMERPIEIRPVEVINYLEPDKGLPLKHLWLKADGQLPEGRALHKCVLAYASDFVLFGASMLLHGLSFLQSGVHLASIDHSMWFHQDFRADEWLLFVIDSPASSNGTGFNRGQVFTREGKLVASITQEVLMRRGN